MQTYILVGASDRQDNFIQELIQKHEIRFYNITEFFETVKIDDVHEIIRKYRIKTSHGHKRLVILPEKITLTAQNALLKFLEELSASDLVVFKVSTKDSLLPTILSRCSIVFLGEEQHEEKFVSEIAQAFQIYDSTSLLKVAEIADSPEKYKEVTVAVRKMLIDALNENKLSGSSKLLFAFLKYLQTQYEIVKENNVNPRLTIEMFQKT